MKQIKNLARHLSNLNTNEWSTFADNLIADGKQLNRLIGHPFPTSVRYFRKGDRPELLPVHLEMLWSATLISKYSSELNCFLKDRKAFDAAVLESRFESALEILNKIEGYLGQSYWLIESKFATLKLLNEANHLDEYFGKLSVAQSTTPFVVNLIISISWLRCTLEGTERMYLDLVNSIFHELSKLNFSKEIEYLQFKTALWSIPISNFENFGVILNGEANSSIVDRYLTLIRVVSFLVAKNDSNAIQNVREILEVLEPIVDQEKTQIADFINNHSQYFDVGDNAFRDYANGEHSRAAIHIASCIQDEKVISANRLIYAEILASNTDIQDRSSRKNDLMESICSHFERLFSRTVEYEDDLEFIKKQVRFFSLSSWASSVVSRLKTEEYLEVPWKLNNCHARLFGIMLPSGDHLKLRYCAEPIFENIKDQVSLLSPLKKLEVLIRMGQPIDEKILYEAIGDKSYRDYKKAYWALSIGDLQTAKRILFTLINISNGSIKVKARIFLLQILLELDLLNFVKYSVKFYVDNPSVLTNIDFEYFIQNYTNSDIYQTLRALPSLSILLHIYDLKKGLVRKRKIADAVDDLLMIHKVKSPLLIPPNTFENDSVRFFFLSEVCIPENREGSIELETLKSVIQERIKICDELSIIHKSREKVYRQESVELRELLTVRKLLSTYNKTKIFVDVKGVKRLFEGVAKEQFSAIKNRGRLQPEKIEIFDGTDKTAKLQIGGNLDFYILQKPYATFRDMFCSDKRYGLNTALSVFIRHGIIGGKIKSSLSRHGLSTRSFNEAIGHRLSSEDEVKKVQHCIRKFSQQIETSIKELTSKKLQMESESNPKGLFDFSVEIDSQITLNHIIILSKLIGEQTTFDDFCTILFNQFWERTEINLKNIRSHLQEQFKAKISDCFAELLRDVRKHAPNSEILIRSVVTAAKNDWARDLLEIVNWFNRGNELEWDDFELGLVIQASLEHTRDLNPDIDLGSQITNNSKSKFLGRSFSALLTILNLVFDNVVKYSKVKAPILDFCADEKDGKLTIYCKNSIPILTELEFEKENRAIEEIIQSLEENNYYRTVDEEERSGISKIKKLITSDLNCDVEITANYPDRSNFELYIEIDIRDLVAIKRTT